MRQELVMCLLAAKMARHRWWYMMGALTGDLH